MSSAFQDAPLPVDTSSIVYYVRRGQVIKIGWTEAPGARFSALAPDEILAFEPGEAVEERMRHRQFWHLRIRGEHFRPEPELLEHIRELRRIYGDPDPAWPTAATLTKAAGKTRGRYWCSQHACERASCDPRSRHVQSIRCSDELINQVAAIAATRGWDRNTGIVRALEEFVQAHGKPEGMIA